MSETMTISHLAERALAAYEELATLAETVEDEWTYVTDLSAAWRERIEGLVAVRGGEPADPSQQAAIDEVIDEVGAIRDPHRAIDWLSTYPQIVLTVLSERP